MEKSIKGITGLASLMAVAACVLLAAAAGPARSQSGLETSSVVAEIQSRYAGIKTVSASFTQEFKSFGFDDPVVTGGRVYFKKPGKMKWIYEKGSEDVLTSDGNTIWLYQPDLAQVLQSKADLGSTIATDFLSGMGDLRKDFDIRLEKQDAEAYVLALKPMSPQPNVERLTLYVDRATRVVTKTEVEDLFGNTTRVTFTDIEINMPVQDSFFVFTPPPGVSVVKQ